jgi:hypothetical protein
MYQPMLFVHWKQVRAGLIPFILGAFALPLLMVQGLGVTPGAETTSLEAYRIMNDFQVWLPLFPLLAGATGITLALSSWNWDHQMKHVYALSLPVARWEYSMLKMGAGAFLAMLPVAALWLGAHVAVASIELPQGLHAYPNQLALRFGLATLISYAFLFAMAAGTIRTTIWIVSGVIGFIIVGNLANELLADYYEFFQRTNMVLAVFEWLAQTPGPIEVFTGNWSLIDV